MQSDINSDIKAALVIHRYNLIMIFWIFTVLIVLYLAFIINKFVIQPLTRMNRYKQYKGIIFLPFIPVAGAFKLTQDAYNKHGDQIYDSKKALEMYPGYRGVVFNALNKCFLSIMDPELIQEFFQKQEHYVKQESFL